MFSKVCLKLGGYSDTSDPPAQTASKEESLGAHWDSTHPLTLLCKGLDAPECYCKAHRENVQRV